MIYQKVLNANTRLISCRKIRRLGIVDAPYNGNVTQFRDGVFIEIPIDIVMAFDYISIYENQKEVIITFHHGSCRNILRFSLPPHVRYIDLVEDFEVIQNGLIAYEGMGEEEMIDKIKNLFKEVCYVQSY